MIKYICKNCDNHICETSKCPICEGRAELFSSDVYYCKICNTPVYEEKCSICGSECERIGTDVRPVFPEERLLLEIAEKEPFKYKGSAIWEVGNGNYIIDGNKKKIYYKKIMENISADYIYDEIRKNEQANKGEVDNFLKSKHIKNFIEANKTRYNYITNEAIDYIKNISKEYEQDEKFVSFSGGKDSTVTSSLVMEAFEYEPIIHIYGDTTIEMADSADYIKEFRKKFPNMPFLVAKNKDQDFYKLCEVLGPPSRLVRWCCTFFKTGAITRKIDQAFKDKKRLLSFQGLRRAESLSRSTYDRESKTSKIGKQITIAPIIDWLEMDVWLYILSKNIPFNPAYRKGYTRVGCYLCPNNSSWPMYLTSIYMKDEYSRFYNMLIDFAKKVGKEDPKEYIDDGGWKKRQGGNGLKSSKNVVVDFKPCVKEENAYNFVLNRDLDESFYELFKPFGKINFDIGNKRLNEVYVLDRNTNEPILKITGRIGQEEIKIKIVNFNKVFTNDIISKSLIKNQITKYQSCMACMACESNCKFDALKIRINDKTNICYETIDYKIDERKCVGCMECVKHFQSGCFLKKVLRTKINND